MVKQSKQIRTRLGLVKLRAKRYQLAADLSVLIGAFVFAYLLRFDFDLTERELDRLLIQLPYVVLIEFLALVLAGVYTFIWRYVGMAEVKSFFMAGWWSSLVVLALRLGLPERMDNLRVPLSVILMNAFFASGGALGVRVLRRAVYEWEKRLQDTSGSGHGNRKSVLLIGAGRAGMIAAREIKNRGGMGLKIEGFVDDDPNKQGKMIQGVKVLGTTQDLPFLVKEYDLDHVIITIAHASRREFRLILDICEQVSLKVKVIPGLDDIIQGRVRLTRIRDLQIEDLLGREPVHLDEENVMSFLTGKTVMVTGGGGSIGSELARQVANFAPGKLLLVERAEFALFEIERELRSTQPDLQIVSLVADVCDETRLRAIFEEYEPHVVLHAAAHKHVPMMESNAFEAVKNNILATNLLGEIAGESGVEVFVLISTDKAVRPTSVMGATKRVAELMIQDLNARHATRYVAVRFGNVIGSTGSVIPIFLEQIQKGGPVTVTHPNMMRYFMTIPEAAQLVLQAGTMGRGGEIFILDMGEPVSILDLARDTISLSGLKPYEDIDIVFTGIRPGEKLFEELNMVDELVGKTEHPKIFIGKIAAYPESKMEQARAELFRLARSGNNRELYKFLSEFLPEARLAASNAAPPTVAVQPQEGHAAEMDCQVELEKIM
ncbi:MAG TPA: nucleoside-diphosphate sugar epimerase/dehydratase [Pyrinomonadaceae bacterium]|jgi:FlaA1/EpsC-like NDP-sugar epimerase